MTDAERRPNPLLSPHHPRRINEGSAIRWKAQAEQFARELAEMKRLIDDANARYEAQSQEYKLARERLLALAEECLAKDAEIARLTAPPGASAMERMEWAVTQALAEFEQSDKGAGDVVEIKKWGARAIEQAEREARAAATASLRCMITKNECGTDTWMVGRPYECASCTAWLAARPDLPEPFHLASAPPKETGG